MREVVEQSKIDTTIIPENFFPKGLKVEKFMEFPGEVYVWLSSKRYESRCPFCGSVVKVRRGSYERIAQDIPYLGRMIKLYLKGYEYRCENRLCRKKSLVEEFKGFLDYRGRITKRFEDLILMLVLEVGVSSATKILQEMSAEISEDTVNRVVRRFLDKKPQPEWDFFNSVKSGRKSRYIGGDMPQFYAEGIAYDMDESILRGSRLDRMRNMKALLDKVFLEDYVFPMDREKKQFSKARMSIWKR